MDMQAMHLEYVSASWDVVSVQMEGCHCGYVTDHDCSPIHAYLKRI